MRFSFSSQGDDWIYLGSAPCRNPTRKQGSQREENAHRAIDDGIDGVYFEEKTSQQTRTGQRSRKPDNQSNPEQAYTLTQDKRMNVRPGGAESESDTNFA